MDAGDVIAYIGIAGCLVILGLGITCFVGRENHTVSGSIEHIDVLDNPDRFNVTFSDGSCFVLDDYVMKKIDGYEGNMTIDLYRCSFPFDGSYWTCGPNDIIKLDSWVRQ